MLCVQHYISTCKSGKGRSTKFVTSVNKQRAISYRKAQDSTEYMCHWHGMTMAWKDQAECSVIRKWKNVKEELEKENWRQTEDPFFLSIIKEHCLELSDTLVAQMWAYILASGFHCFFLLFCFGFYLGHRKITDEAVMNSIRKYTYFQLVR